MRHDVTVRMLALQADEAVVLDKIAEVDARLPDDRAIAECHRRGLFVRLHGIRFALARIVK